MKKLIYILCLCVCLNGAAALSEAVEPEEAVVMEAQQAEEEEAPEEAEPEEDEPDEDAPEAEEPEEDEPEQDDPEEAEPRKEPEAPEEKSESEAPREEKPAEDTKDAPAPQTEEPTETQTEEPAETQTEETAETETAPAPTLDGNEISAQAGEEPGQTGGETSDPVDGAENNGNTDGQNTDDQNPDGQTTPTDGQTTPDDGQTTPDEGQTTPDEGDQTQGMPADAEAWVILDGRQTGGSLSDIVDMLSGDETVYIRSSDTLYLKDAPLYKLAGVRFRPDADVFSEDYLVKVYSEDPEGKDDASEADLSGVSEGDTGDLYIRVEQREADVPADDPKDEITITVTPDAFETGVWQTKQPTFKLSGMPSDKDWNYAVMIFDERIIPLSGNSYKLEAEGIYTLRFLIEDRMGDIKAVSRTVRGWFDWTAPKAVIATATDEDYAIDITGTDATSGVVAVSVDSGKTWVDVEDGEIYRYSANKKRTLQKGAIRIRDAAGNIYKSTKAYTLDKAPKLAGVSTGTSTKKKELPHSSGDPEDAAPYAVKLELPEGAMRQLTIDGQAKDLTLMVDRTASGGSRKPADFTATLTNWLTGDSGEVDDPDTLILEADVAMEDAFDCEWRFNGEVYRELSDCGIKYLAFRVGNDLCAVPTEGFTGGSKYTELKMLGVSTRKFDYTLTMKLRTDPGHVTALTENDFSQDCDLALAVEVENMSYELSSSPKSLMYYYDVYLGPEDMIEYPFGRYDG